VSFDAYVVDTDAEFGYRTYQNYEGYPFTEVQLVVDNETLRGYNANTSAFVDCGDFDAGAWHNVAVFHSFSGGTFDVELDGTASSCAGLGMIWGDGTPFGYIQVVDWADADYGGEVWYDNFLGEIAAD
jgi:hypothetical protein